MALDVSLAPAFLWWPVAALRFGVGEALTFARTELGVFSGLQENLLTPWALLDWEAHTPQQRGEEIQQPLPVKWRQELVINEALLILRIALYQESGRKLCKRELFLFKEFLYVPAHLTLKVNQLRHG